MQYAILNFHWLPAQWLSLNKKEKAFVIASINNRVRAEQEQERRMKSRR